MVGHSTDEQRFSDAFDENYNALLAYALRRCASRSDAEDLVSETFSVAWRRIDELPVPDEDARAWLYGVARNVKSNLDRSARRRTRLGAKVAAAWGDTTTEQPNIERSDVIRAALQTMRPQDREVLMLANWDGLNHAQIAIVLDCSAGAVAQRIHGAKARLNDAISKKSEPSDKDSDGAGHE